MNIARKSCKRHPAGSHAGTGFFLPACRACSSHPTAGSTASLKRAQRRGQHTWGPEEKAGRAAGEGSCVSKELIWAPKKLRCTLQSSPPSSAWPPSF